MVRNQSQVLRDELCYEQVMECIQEMVWVSVLVIYGLREGSTYHISWDHKHFIFYLNNEDNINLSAYISNRLCEAIKDNTKLQNKNVPYARLL